MMVKKPTPFLAQFFKGIAVIVVFVGILIVFLGLAGIWFGLILILVAAPVAWWLGAVIAYLARIADATEARAEVNAETAIDTRSGSFDEAATTAPAKSIFAELKTDLGPDSGEVPSYKL